MTRLCRVVLLLCVLASCAACGPKATPTPQPTATPTPTATPLPTNTPFPTASELAPAATFTAVGNTATFSGTHGVSGKAIVAGLQTLIIQGFSFDGKGSVADVRLVLGEDYANPVAVLFELEQREYKSEMLYMIIPSSALPESADSIAIYCADTGEAYASQLFQ